MPEDSWYRIPIPHQLTSPSSGIFSGTAIFEVIMEAKAIAIIADLIASNGLSTAIRRIQTLDPDRVRLEDLGALTRGSLADPDCHFSSDDSAFADEEDS